MRKRTGCLLCGAPLAYDARPDLRPCTFCGREIPSAMSCVEGHFVCDDCHGAGAIEAIERMCLTSTETDMVALMARTRLHPSIAMHGPEHHGLVPGVILAACRNAGAIVSDEMIRDAIRRGAKHPGGSCGYAGTCGAAMGLGIAFSTALAASPIVGPLRGEVLRLVGTALARLGALDAPRCCQRDCWFALQVAAERAPDLLGVSPTAHAPHTCREFESNRECTGTACPLYPQPT